MIYPGKARCYPLSNIKVKDSEKYVILGSEYNLILHQIRKFPIIVRVTSMYDKILHCGATEFTAKQGNCFIPDLIMKQMGLKSGYPAILQVVDLPVGESVTLQCIENDYREFDEFSLLLYEELDGRAAITEGEIITVKTKENIVQMVVISTTPKGAIYIGETDLEVQILPLIETKSEKLTPFPGCGHRLGGDELSLEARLSKLKRRLLENLKPEDPPIKRRKTF